MSISVPDDRWLIYGSEPNSDTYKGFKLIDPIKTRPGQAQISFSNGEKSFTVNEHSIEAAFIKAFDIIDTMNP